jgi:hypothetical protein
MRMTGGVVELAVVCLLLRAAPGAAQPQLVGPFAKDEYPQAVIDRPLTLPAGMVEGEVGTAFSSTRFPSPDPTYFSVNGIDQWTMDGTLRVGVTDRFQAEAGTSFSLDYQQRGDHGHTYRYDDIRPTFASWQHVVPTRLSFLALDTEALDTAVALTVPFVAHASRTIGVRKGSFEFENTNGHVIPLVGLEAPTRWRITDWLWVRAGEDLFNVTTDSVYAFFSFPIGIGVQPHPMFAMTLDSRIATVAFNGSGDSFSETIADRGTIDLEGTLAPCRWFDFVGAMSLPDVGRGFDDWATRMAVRVRF